MFLVSIWTGDNLGTWKHLASASPMILANGVGGMAWSGGMFFIQHLRLHTNSDCFSFLADIGG